MKKKILFSFATFTLIVGFFVGVEKADAAGTPPCIPAANPGYQWVLESSDVYPGSITNGLPICSVASLGWPTSYCTGSASTPDHIQVTWIYNNGAVYDPEETIQTYQCMSLVPPPPTTLSVSANHSGVSWSVVGVTPVSGTGSGGPYTVGPGNYTLSKSDPSGYLCNVYNDISGNSSTLYLNAGESGNFTIDCTTTLTPPPTPTGLSASGYCNGVSPAIMVSWNTSSGADDYSLYRNSSAIYSGPGTSYNDTGVSAGVTYSYQVEASNSAGVSPISSSVSGTAPSNCAPPPPPAPTVNIISASPNPVSAIGNTTTLTWTSTNATSCTASGASSWSGSKQVNGTFSQPSVAVPTNPTTFVLSCTGAGGSAQDSETVTVTPPPPPPLAQCEDDVDNDGDTKVDHSSVTPSGFQPDPGCASASDNDEINYACSDGSDNDVDGLVDGADPGCGGGGTDNDETDPIIGTLGGSCSATPFGTVSVGQQVSWSVTPSGCSGTCSYVWTGTNIPIGASGNPYLKTYATVGLKSMSVRISDSGGSTPTTVSCNGGNTNGDLRVKFSGSWLEF